MPESDELLLFTNDGLIQQKISYYCTTYTLETISNYLNGIMDNLSPKDRVICAELLVNLYRNEEDFLEKAPTFFVDTEGKPINNGQILIKSSECENLRLPDFLNLRYLDDEYTTLLLNHATSFDGYGSVAGVEQNFARAYGIKEADTEEILGKLDEEVRNNEKLIPAYVKWLYENRDSIPSSNNNYMVLNLLGQPCRSHGVYFGKSYNPESELDKIYDKSKIIADSATFGIDKNDIENFTGFLKMKLGVADMPRRTGYEIDGLSEVLQYGSMEFIIGLILHYRELLSYPSPFICNAAQGLENLKYAIRHSSWIVRKGKRFAPNDVLLTSQKTYLKMGKYLNGILVVSKDDLFKKIKIDESVKVWLTEEFLVLKKVLRDFNNSTIYSILNNLPNFDADGMISECVFNDIILKNDERAKPTDADPEFRNFVNFGKVYCFDKQYHAVKDCLYLREEYPDIVKRKFNFIYLSKGKSSDAILDRLGINTLNIEYSLDSVKKSSMNSKSFHEDIDNLKIAMLARNDDGDGLINTLKHLEIILCEDITIRFEEKIDHLKEYEFVEENGKYYVNVPCTSYLNLKKNDTKFQAAIDEIFVRNCKCEKDSVAYLMSLDVNARKEKIIDEYGRDKWFDASEKLSLTEEVKEDYSDENINALSELRDKCFEEYEKRLYSSLINEDADRKRNFVRLLREYQSYDFSDGDVPVEKDADLKGYLCKNIPGIFTGYSVG